MEKIKQINNWIIKEKKADEVPCSIDLERRYCVFSPSGVFQEDNLLLEEAVKFCQENLDYVKGVTKTKKVDRIQKPNYPKTQIKLPELNANTWEEASQNADGIETIAVEINSGRIVGYNDILRGDLVLYNEEEYTVVMVSRLGHMGLSKTGYLPYTEIATPTELTKTKHSLEGNSDVNI